MSKLDYGSVLLRNTSQINKRRMQKVLNVTCSFDVQKYATESDVLKTKWLPVKECIKFSICQMAHKSIIDKHFLSYLGLKIREHRHHLRNNLENTV